MKISIITATYNSSSVVARCIASVDEQTHPDIEHIIVDGASTDNTLEIIQKTPNLVTQIISEPDKGIYDALNKGIKLATGDIIGFLHSDDCFYSPEIIKYITNAFKDDVDVLYGDLIFVDKKDSNKIVRYWKSKPFEQKLLRQGWMPPHPTLFMRREVYEKHGSFNTNLKCAADYDFILRVFQDQSLNVIYLPEVITKMQIGGVSTTGFKSLINKKREDYLVLKSNRIPYPLWVLFLKNILKIPQLFLKEFKTLHLI
jgi:glycosyltransferase involved in cell wall biosynthesis